MSRKRRALYGVLFCAILLAEIGIALFVHDSFVRPYVGDVLVSLLLCCFCRVLFPNGIPALPVYVFLFSAAVEIGQYFDVVALLGLQENSFISILLGRTFSFADLLCYAVGCLLFFLLDVISRRFG